MGKLFNLKEWLTVADAARQLSIVFGEDVTEADVLRLGLDGQLRLSVYLAHYVPAKPAKLIPVPMEIKRVPGFTFNSDQMVCINGDEITNVIGVLDLPMIGSERSEIEDRCCSLLNGKSLQPPEGYHVLVQDAGGLYELQQRLADPVFVQFEESDDHDQILRKCADQAYCPARGLPEDAVLVVRTEALREFEQSLNRSAVGVEKPVTTSERNSLLAIIAALCDHSAIKPHERGAASQIAKMTEEMGAPVSDDTVRRVLAKIPDALESRMK